MSDYKMQHYVPQFYLKNFSDDRGRTINLYNLKRCKAVLNSSLRRQCSQAYFYGKDCQIEKTFGILEKPVSRIVRMMVEDRIVPPHHSDEAYGLLLFVIGLYFRTQRSAEEFSHQTDKLGKVMLRQNPDFTGINLDEWQITPNNPTITPLKNSLTLFPLTLDLERKLICNRSNEPFITSDHPVAFYNQYMEGYQEGSCTGLASKGLQIFLPISPIVMLFLYDPKVYRVGSRKSNSCELYSDAEALKLNELQWLTALENVYYSPSTRTSSIEAQASPSVMKSRKTPLDTVCVSLIDGSQRDTGPLLKIYKHDLNVRLRPSFVKITRNARKVSRADRKHQVRSENMIQGLDIFRIEVKRGNYHEVEFFKFVRDKSRQDI